MARGKGRHAHVVPSFNTPLPAQAVQDPLSIGASRNFTTILPLTPPLTRSVTITKPAIKKKPNKKPVPIRKVGLELFELEEKESGSKGNQVGKKSMGSGEFGIVKRSQALNASIAAVLASRPTVFQQQEESRFLPSARFLESQSSAGLAKTENLSAAGRLRANIQEENMEESEPLIVTSIDEADQMQEDQDLSDSDSEEIVVTWLAHSKSTESDVKDSSNSFPTITFQSLAPSAPLALDRIQVDKSRLEVPEANFHFSNVRSDEETEEDMIISKYCDFDDEKEPETNLMELDEIYADTEGTSLKAATNYFTTSPTSFFTSSKIPLISPSFIPPPYSAPVLIPSLEPTFLSTTPANFETDLSSDSPIVVNKSIPLRSAAPVTKGRIRKPKKIKRPAKLFDYLSDESEDWDDPTPAATSKRPRSGRALPGDTAPFPAAPGEKEIVVVDPEMILPNTRAHAVKLNPTSYQQALLESAMKDNVIVVLETGSGKTLISVLLIEWIHTVVEPERLNGGLKKRMQFVLTNSVPLVHQQANVLSHNSSLRVGKLFGALNVNLSSKEEWEWSFDNFDCLVLTAQLLLDSLAHGFIDMTQIALLVFDEAHHAKSNHPFASILRDFYHRTEPTLRPKILGLTASPLDSNEGMADAKRLQDLFNARLVTAPVETRHALREMVSRPTILEVSYKPPPTYANTPLNISVHEKYLGSQSAIERVLGPQEEEENSNEVIFSQCARAATIALSELGPAACDLVYHLALVKYERQLLESADPELEPYIADDADLDPEFAVIHPKKSEEEEAAIKSDKELEMKEREKNALKLPDWLLEVKRHKMDPPRRQSVSPKLQALVRLLEACENVQDDFCGIIFVNRRLDAVLIAQLLRQFAKSNKALSWMRVKCVTGHGGGNNTSLGPKMNWNDQAEVLTAFGAGSCNLLIATQVIEEGLDVQPCNFVARFDLPSTHISYVQSRGRARRAGSHYILFVQEGNHSDRRKLAQIHKYDLEMEDLLDHVEQNFDENADYGDDDESPEDYLLDPSTGALLTPHFAVSLLYRYCQSLPKSDSYNLNKPVFDIQERTKDSYICTVTLPPSSRVRTLTSNPCTSPKIAKRAASFMACKLLRRFEALDEHLLPIRMLTGPGVEEVKDENGKTVGSKKRQIGYEKKLSNPFHVSTPFTAQSPLYGTYLRFSGPRGEMTLRGEVYAPMILLTRNPLPKTPILKLFIDGQPFLHLAEPLNGNFTVSQEQREVLKAYTLQVFSSTLNRPFEVEDEEVLYFVAPLREDRTASTVIDINSLDWKLMAYAAVVKEEKLKMNELDGLEDTVIVDYGKNECRYFFKTLHPELHPNSQLPPGRQSDAGFFNVLDYYTSFNEPYFHKFHVDPTQPLFEVMRMPRVVSYLTATPRNNSSVSQKKLLERVPRFALPQVCSKHSLPSSHFRTQLMLPSILTELDQLMLVQELNAKLFNKKIDAGLLRQCLNTPAACLEDDYQRLELLGDAFLKYVVSVWCFVAMDKVCHEGELHHTRLTMINNAALFRAGVKLDLPEYLVSRPFTSRLFIPPNFKLLKGVPPPHLALIGDKTIADVCEAIMGAAYETGIAKDGIRGGFDLALEATLTLKVEMKGIRRWDDFARVYGSITNTIPVAEVPTQLEEKLHRRFIHGYLLTEALTHPSKLDAAASFQRLEWLGDSILDFCVIRYSWEKFGGHLPPGHLTELKGAMVSNETLAALAVELDLDKYLAHDNALLAKSLEVYRKKLAIAKAKELKEAAEELREARPFWLLLDAPKAISDIIESLFGAILVDSGFDPAAPQLTFDKLLAPFYDQWVSPTKLRIDAIRILLEIAQSHQCNDVSHISTTIDGKVDENGILTPKICKTSVIAHDVVLATVATVNPKTAKRMVSADALIYLEQNPSFFSRVCDCENRRAIAREEAEEELQRRIDEGLISPPSSDDEEDDEEEDDDDEGYEGSGRREKEDKMDEN